MLTTSALPQISVFLSVARLRSFTAAARELGVSPSAVSQAVKQLEASLHVVLLARTTRSVALTDAGKRLVQGAAPALTRINAAVAELSAPPGELVGKVKVSVPRTALPHLIEPIIPAFRARHPRVDVEIVVEDRFVDLVQEGYDAGVRLTESIARDMVQVRITDAFRFVIVGAPRYFTMHARPEKPADLLEHDCIGLRSQTTGALYAWELERGRRNWRVPVRGGIVTNDAGVRILLALRGIGLTYAAEPAVAEHVRTGRLQIVLESYAPKVPGFFLYFPSRAQSSRALRAFVDMAKELGAPIKSRTKPLS